MADLTSRHRRDVVSLVTGLLFMAGAGLFLLTDATQANVDLRWAGPAVLIGVGALGLLASVRRRSSP